MVEEPELDELSIGESFEVEKGVVVQRRCLLKTMAGLLGLAALPGAIRAQALAEADDISLEEFFAIVNPIAQKLVEDTSAAGQDRYLVTIAAYALRLAQVPEPASWRDSGQGAGPGTFIGFHPGGEPLRVLHWRMAPNTVIRTHAHTYGNVVTLGLGGRVRVRNYEMLGERDFTAKGRFEVRQTRNQELTRHGINLVNLEHDYMHGFTAGPEGGHGLDITTRIRPRPSVPVPYLELDRLVDGEQGIFEATWAT